MAKEEAKPKEAEKEKSYEKPKGVETKIQVKGQTCLASADWLILRKKEKPVAEMFHVYYRLAGSAKSSRPVTFVFNGGPGAASAYLHVGALGPKRVRFESEGGLPRPPAQLIDNQENWLQFTDLVFVDPVGTGFSRTVAEAENARASTTADKEAEAKLAQKQEESSREFYQLNRDLDALCEFISKFLSAHKLWSRPIFIAGESYGGFRVAKLARRLQSGVGVGLSGAILISPALELSLLDYSDYDVLPWTDVFPSLVASAVFHGKCRSFKKGEKLEKVLPEAHEFGLNKLSKLLMHGDALSKKERASIISETADLLGLPPEFIDRKAGRVSSWVFVRELLREERRVCGLYDASATTLDPFPDREMFHGPDPTLFTIERAYTAGINMQLREILGLETERDYHLLSEEINTKWIMDCRRHAFETHIGATEDLRYGMALNTDMHVFITHGFYDLVTPYFASDRLVQLMKLQDSQRERLTLKHFQGGHMFYMWEKSRVAFRGAMKTFYDQALA